MVNKSLAYAGDTRDVGSFLGRKDPLEQEMAGNSLQCSCLGNAMDRGAWQAIVHGAAKSWTRLSDCTFTFFGALHI